MLRPPGSQNYHMPNISRKIKMCHTIYLSCFTKLSYLISMFEILRHPTTHLKTKIYFVKKENIMVAVSMDIIDKFPLPRHVIFNLCGHIKISYSAHLSASDVIQVLVAVLSKSYPPPIPVPL